MSEIAPGIGEIVSTIKPVSLLRAVFERTATSQAKSGSALPSAPK